jgi:hypothetical protein
MSQERKSVNQHILNALKEGCEDELIERFLRDLIFLEANGEGRWKETYKARLAEVSKNWGAQDEN